MADLRVSKIYFGVLAEFSQHFLKYFDLPRHPAESWDDPRFRKNFHKTYENKDFWLSIPAIIPTSIYAHMLKPSCYITARPIPNDWSMEWLWKNGFPYAPLFTVGEDGSKVELVREHCDIFIDDALHNFDELWSENLPCILLTRSHNKSRQTKFRLDSIRNEDVYEMARRILDTK